MRILNFGLSLAAVVALIAPQAHAVVDYSFICTSPADCDGDAGFSAVFSFDAATPLDLASLTFSAADARFLGWTTTSGVGDGYSESGSTFVNNSNSEIEFTFSGDGQAITSLIDIVETSIAIGSASGVTTFRDGSDNAYFLNSRVDNVGGDGTDVQGLFKAVTTVIPLPAGLPLLAGALALLGVAGWRRPRTGAA